MKLTISNSILLTAGTIFLIGVILVWEYFNGGVKTHYLLQDDTLPGISNYWGLLVGGLLAWISLYRIREQVQEKPEMEQQTLLKKAFSRFIAAFAVGFTIALFFYMDFAQVSEFITLGIVLISFFIPLYKIEYLLGYVLGVSFMIGVPLPTFFGLILILLCWTLYTIPRWIFVKLKPKKHNT